MKYELLVIDDEPSILCALAELLMDDDINVTTAQNGLEGLELLRSRSFDVVASDLNMPMMNGLEMLEVSRAEGIFTPHIFFTANSSVKLKESLIEAGAAAVVQKPHFERLSQEINSVLVKKEFLNTGTMFTELACQF